MMSEGGKILKDALHNYFLSHAEDASGEGQEDTRDEFQCLALTIDAINNDEDLTSFVDKNVDWDILLIVIEQSTSPVTG